MIRFVGQANLVAVILAASAPCATIGEKTIGESPPQAIYVRTYDYAGVPPLTLHQAKSLAARVLKRAGIVVIWLSDPVRGATVNETRLETGSPEHKQVLTQLSVRIYPPKLSRRLGAARTVLGYAFQPEEESGFGTIAIVFYDKAELLAELGVASREVTLGHIIAHELGHLLLGTNSHAGSGIMHVPWDRATLKRATSGWLNFTPEEVLRLRQRLIEREKMAVREMTAAGGP